MDLTALRAELLARGANYLDSSGTTRQDRFINRGLLKVWFAEPWYFARTTTTGTAPLTISDLGNVRAVVDTTNKRRLTHLEDRALIDDVDVDLATTGTPAYWYLTSDTGLSVYPANTSASLKVWYVKKPATLTNGTDTPAIPTEFHLAIVDAAMVEVYKDSDNYELRAMARQELEDSLGEMRAALLFKNHADPEFLRVTSPQDY